jgi:hypothetical protein
VRGHDEARCISAAKKGNAGGCSGQFIAPKREFPSRIFELAAPHYKQKRGRHKIPVKAMIMNNNIVKMR